MEQHFPKGMFDQTPFSDIVAENWHPDEIQQLGWEAAEMDGPEAKPPETDEEQIPEDYADLRPYNWDEDIEWEEE